MIEPLKNLSYLENKLKNTFTATDAKVLKLVRNVSYLKSKGKIENTYTTINLKVLKLFRDVSYKRPNLYYKVESRVLLTTLLNVV